MHSQIRLSASAQKFLRCPVCRAELERLGDQFRCIDVECATVFPIVEGVPVLINEKASIFSINDIVRQAGITGDSRQNMFRKIASTVIPSISKNIKSKQHYDRFSKLLLRRSNAPKVLILGGSILGQGMQSLLLYPSLELIETDVSFGPRTALVCDAHDIPFADESIEGVIIQAVLEHVVDPCLCVEEIHRVLKKQGLVYAETPFMQQVHSGRYDFTRFTHLGHRRLFRRFEELDSGAVCGPGMALAWSYHYFLLSFTRSRISKRLVGAFACLTAFYLKYCDYFLIDKSGALDAASSYYFIGQKSSKVLPDRDLIKLYRGGQN